MKPATVTPGGAAVVDVTGLVPNRGAHVVFGHTPVATGSTDAEGKASIPFTVPSDATEALHLITVGSDGTALTADCGINVSSAPVNTPPLANAGPDQTVECTSPSGASVTLDGTASSDPDGDTLTFTWTGPFGTASGPKPTVTLPLGTHAITLTVDDGKDGTASDTVIVKVVDTTPPNIKSVTAKPNILWPPNHKMIPVMVAVAASDSCNSTAPICKIISVSSNEPINGLGDGDTAPDWQITGDLTVNLRAERSGKGNGRVYTITVQCTDASGNSSTKTVTVTVPHDRRKK